MESERSITVNISRGIINLPQKVVLYGPEGIGKSTFGAAFPNPLFLDVEHSTQRLDVARIDPPPVSWTGLLETVKGFLKEKPSEFSTIVLDTADWAEQMCIIHVCAKAQKDGIESFGYGKGYVYVAEEFGKLLNCLEEIIKAGYNVVILAHAKMRKFEQPDEMGSYDRWEMKLSKNVAPMLKEWADMVLFANYKTIVVSTDDSGKKHKAQGGKRVMYTTHHACWDAKNRHGLADELPLSYEQIRHCIPVLENPEAGIPVSEVPPVAVPEIKGAAEPAPAAKPEERAKGPAPSVPEAVAQLMSGSKVTDEEVLKAIGNTGYFTADTPWNVMQEQGFIDGWLVPNWDYVVKTIENDPYRLPF